MAGASYSLKFTKAGTYSYVCFLHADQGMAGVIEVGGTTGAPSITAPNTGDAGLASTDNSLASWQLGGGVFVAVLAVFGGLLIAQKKATSA